MSSKCYLIFGEGKGTTWHTNVEPMRHVNPNQRRFEELSVMNQKQLDDIFVKTHMDFKMKRAKGGGRGIVNKTLL